MSRAALFLSARERRLEAAYSRNARASRLSWLPQTRRSTIMASP